VELHPLPVPIDDPDQIIDVFAHERFRAIRITRQNPVDDLSMLVDKRELRTFLARDEIEQGRESTRARIDGEPRHGDEHLVVRGAGDKTMQVERGIGVTAASHDVIGMRVSKRAQGRALFIGGAQSGVPGGFRLDGAADVEEIDQLVDIGGGSGANQESGLLVLALHDFQFLEA
jgi:hypothetical protein